MEIIRIFITEFLNEKDMATATLLNQIYHLPLYERILIAERTIHSIREDKRINEPDAIQTHFASEQVLAKDWSNKTEDEAWQGL
jgi:hypothetical protein